jgi:CRP/FNR family transcriptional regulator
MKVEAVALTQALSAPSRAELLGQARPLSAAGGELLVQKGDALSDVYLVTAGVLRIYALSTDGKEATLYRLRPGEVCLLSLNAAFTGGLYPANVRVESEAAEVLRIPGGLLRRLFGVEPAVQALVLGSLTATVGELIDQLDRALLSSLRERLVDHLARTADSAGRTATTHQDLADSLGVSREAVSRELARLRRGGRMSGGRGWVRLNAAGPPAR